MENKDKELTVPKWVLINQPKIPKVYTPQLSVLAQKFGILMKKGFIGRLLSVIKAILYNALYRCPPFVQPPGHKREPRGYKAGQHQKSDNL